MSSPIVVLRRRLADPLAARVERGQTLVLVALAAAGILGMCALGIDLARLYDARSEAQNAADHAATTASFASCRLNKAPAAAISDGMAAASVNGFDNDGSTNTVSVLHITGTQFRANTTRTIDTSFAAVIGWASLDAAATALGDCTASGGGGAAMFAGGDSCAPGSLKQIEVSGSNNEVYGGVRSNRDINIGGSGNDFDLPAPASDPFEYVGTLNPGSGNTFESPTYPKDIGPSVPVPPWPSGWAPSDANAAMYATYQALAVANDTNFTGKITSITKDGVYYTSSSDGMDIGSVTGANRSVVLVAPNGPIKISASSKTFNPYNGAGVPRQNVLMVSGEDGDGQPCDKYAIAVSGSSSSWNGITWAPHALIEMSGSSNTAVNGGLIGHAIRLNGSDIVITYDAEMLGTPEVLLLE